ncbi:MAG: electron transfer flavoprotein-ubiquinone oxidoreductase [Desulfobacterales bacterium]
MSIEREQIEFDVLFVGGGPACLAGAIKLMQLARKKGIEIETAVIEKGAEIGSHALSGAVINPIALAELIPDYTQKNCPLEKVVREDEFYFLTRDKALKIPGTPKYMHNKGFYIVSLSKLTRWLGQLAEETGVNVFTGFAGKEILFDSSQRQVIGVRTDDKGLDKEGKPKANFEPGIDILAKVTVFGEGARGSLMKQLSEKLPIFEGKMPQVFETGIKEVIQLPENNYFGTNRGNDIHTLGYPIGLNTAGGGFIYEMQDNRITMGYLISLAYEDPRRDLYDTFMQFKLHPFVGNIIKGGKVIESGARTVSTGGYYTIPKLSVDGAVFVGGAAGMQNVPGLKGIHTSMKSGMLAAEAIMAALESQAFTADSLGVYQDLFNNSWLREEIYEGRNFSQALAKKMPIKMIYLGAQYVTRGKGLRDPMPITEDFKTLKTLKNPTPESLEPVDRKIYDGQLYVDKLTGVYLSKTIHREDQPSHIIVHDTKICIEQCYPKFKSPCTRFCPGNVYEIEHDDESSKPRLKLNPANCLHCKTCDIKDPFENITWTCPEGGEGPGYTVV